MIIKTMTLDNLRPVHQGSSEIARRYQQIKNLLKDGSHILFAEPEYLSAKEVEWKTTLDGEFIQYTQADEKMQDIIRIQLRQQVNIILNHEKIKDDQEIVDYLNLILEIPNLDNIFYINNTVVICNWGYIEDKHSAEREIIKKLIDDVSFSVYIEDEDRVIVSELPIKITYGKDTKKYITDQNGQIDIDVIYGSTVYIDINLKDNHTYKEDSVQENILCLSDKTETTIILKLAEVITPLPKIPWFVKHKKKLLAIVALLLIILSILFLMFNSENDVSITVYDKSTNSVVENANVKLSYLKDGNVKTKEGTTSSNGKISKSLPYTLEKISIKVNKRGYKESLKTDAVMEKDIKIYLDKLTHKEITITVYDKNTNSVIENANVKLSYLKDGNKKTKEDVTDSNGKISKSLPYMLEKMSVKINKAGYQESVKTDIVIKKDIKIYLDKLIHKEITIEVYDKKTGQPIAGAEVKKVLDSNNYTTDNSGKVVLKIQEDDVVKIEVSALGYYSDDQSKKTITSNLGLIHKFYLKKMVTLSKEKKGLVGDPRINITWNEKVDIDLWVFDPCGNKIYYSKSGNKKKSHEPMICQGMKGMLDVDSTSSSKCSGTRKKCQENITWTTGGARGTYRVVVNHYSSKRLKARIELTIVNNGEIIKKNFSLTNAKEKYKYSFQH